MEKKIVNFRGFDPSIYLVAKQFFDAANYIPKTERRVAYIVNLAFAIELFIKSLDVSNTIEFDGDDPFAVSHNMEVHPRVNGHSLLKMFNKLPKPIIQALSEEYRHKYSASLESDLGSIKNAFLDYRYLFEKEFVSVNLTALERVSAFLKAFIESKYR